MQQVYNKCVCVLTLLRAGRCGTQGENEIHGVFLFQMLPQAGIQDADEAKPG